MYFFFNDTATTEIYTLSLHDALPISAYQFYPTAALDPSNIFLPYMWGFRMLGNGKAIALVNTETPQAAIDIIDNNGGLQATIDRKSTRLNSSHMSESRMPSSA